MPFPKLSPLQSRLAASLIASITLLMLYFAFSSPHFAYAVDVDSIQPEDHNHERLGEGPFFDVEIDGLELRDGGAYEGDFLGYDRGIMGRADTVDVPEVLISDRPDTRNVVQGGINYYSFLKASVLADPSSSTVQLPSTIGSRDMNTEERSGENSWPGESEDDQDLRLKPRQSTRTSGTVYISVNTCAQPNAIQDTTVEPPPQLRLYVSLSANNTNPGPTKDPNTQQMQLFEGGIAMMKVNASDDIFIGIYGESTTAYKDVWNAQVAASIEGYYHTFHNGTDSNLFLVDSDTSSALLVTGNLTNENSSSPVYQAWMRTPPPFTIFASNKDDRRTLGLQNSMCALLHLSDIAPAGDLKVENVEASITNRGNNQPRQQFYINGLTKASSYNVILGMSGNVTGTPNVAGGGGQLWPMTNIRTLSDGNCAVIHDLSFCTETAYAVPANPDKFPNATALAAFYDNSTQKQYDFFQKALAQIPCETTSSAQYSLARNCSDCSADYKQWLCSVTIPRCTDFSSTLPWLQSRNGSSRNPNIDAEVQPGPYKEILPCDDLCYKIVQSCPAALNFACPRQNQIIFNQSYGLRPDGTPDQQNQITCNYPGAEFGLLSRGSMISKPHIMVFVALVVMTLMFI